ncbi:heavy-metal-associated domain-containing protein [Viscerimonas tarda]
MKKYFLTIVAGMLILSACNSSNSNAAGNEATPSEEVSVVADEHAMLGVQGMCDMCKARIEKAASGVKGVSAATWDGEKKEVHLNFDSHQTSVDAISKAIAKSGHDTDKDKADDAVYDALPGCCKYR